jgi:energy-coupling factor transporter ATP-binding protein EcfA2
MALEVSDIRFGDIDARHEILSRDPVKRRLFLDSFSVPDQHQLKEILSGEKYLLVGPKGSGKTAYLRYIHHHLNETQGSLSRFIIFRDEVTSQERQKLSALANFRFYDSAEMTSEDEQLQDCVSAWQLFIHREIATLLSRSNDICAKGNDELNYISLLEKFFSNFRTSKFKQFLRRITKGRMKIGGLGSELEVEAEFIDTHGNIDVSEFVRYCNSIVSRLDFNSEKIDPRINIFFDELNISFVSGADFKKNAVLIRDLVSACGILNTLFGENNIPIYVYTAIRSEVVDSVESSVRELRKWVDDKAVHLNWYIPGENYQSQPIIELLKKRLEANEKAANPKFSKEIKLEEYFEKRINGRPVADFLIFESWARPRDLVRLLCSAAKFVSKGAKFNSDCFHKSKSDYSHGSWEEKRDELNSKYSQADIDNIKRVLTGFQTTFTLTQLETRLITQSKKDPRINQFATGRVIEVVLEDLYRVGILGSGFITSR